MRTLKPRAKRVKVNSRFVKYDRLIPSFVTNISRTGAFLHWAEGPPEPGQEVVLDHTIVTDEIHRIRGRAIVVRQSHSPPGVGVEFVAITNQTRRLIDRLTEVSTNTGTLPLATSA